VTVRRFLVLAGAIGLAFLGSIALIDRATRPAAGGSSAPPERAPAPLPPPRAHAAARPPVAAAPSPQEPVVSRPAERGGVSPPPPAPVPGAARVDVSFKLDRRLTSGLHMGDRWVSPRTYTSTGERGRVGVEARARVVGGGAGRPIARTAWTASEPDMVEVSPGEGDEVRITVWRPGESRLTVTAGAASGTLTVRAAEVRGALRVDIVR
jgi:hypothetical protein